MPRVCESPRAERRATERIRKRNYVGVHVQESSQKCPRGADECGKGKKDIEARRERRRVVAVTGEKRIPKLETERRSPD